MTKESRNNPFDLSTEVKGTVAKLEFGPRLISLSNQKATELMLQVGSKPELHDLANRVLDVGQTEDVIQLILEVFGQEDISSESLFLKEADEDQLSRLLESRRSDRRNQKPKVRELRFKWPRPSSGPCMQNFSYERLGINRSTRRVKN